MTPDEHKSALTRDYMGGEFVHVDATTKRLRFVGGPQDGARLLVIAHNTILSVMFVPRKPVIRTVSSGRKLPSAQFPCCYIFQDGAFRYRGPDYPPSTVQARRSKD